MSAEEHRSGPDKTPAGSDDQPETASQPPASQQAASQQAASQQAASQHAPGPPAVMDASAGNAGEPKVALQSDNARQPTDQPEAVAPSTGESAVGDARPHEVDAAAAGEALPGDLPAIPGQNSDLTDAGATLGAGSTEVVSSGGRGESQRALSVASARGFRLKMLRWRRQLAEISAMEPTLMTESDALLRKRSLALRYRAMAGERLGSLLPEGYALVREAGRRALKMRHYDVQIVGGISLFEGCIAEMQTGEGKTLTATLPLYLHSLLGKGAHLATVNDYLAHRDAEWMRPLFERLGLTVGVIQTQDDQGGRRTSMLLMRQKY